MSSSSSFGSKASMVALGVVVLGLTAGANGCGSEGSEFNDGTGGASSSGNSSSGSTGGFGSNGGTGDGGDGTNGGPGGPGGTCARGAGQTNLQPLDMFIMFDSSISMRYNTAGTLLDVGPADCDVNTNPPKDSRWCKSVVALSAYLNSAAATGNRAALQFFGSGSCNGTAYSNAVEPQGSTGYRPLPSNLFDDNLNGATPDQQTPLEGALRGLIAFTGRAQNREAGRRTINVLITDADTSTMTCDTNIGTLSGLLSAHFTATQVQTFVIGMTGADFGVLETLATGGNSPVHGAAVGAVTGACGNGAATCRSWNVGNGNGNILAEAMKAIQQTAVGCKLRMPKPETGTLDLNQVHVEYSPAGNPPVRRLTRVANAGACVADGFFYDNNDNPTTIELCKDICTTVSADPAGKVEVVAACITGATSSSGGGVILK